MDEALLDTDIFSEVLKGRNAAVRARAETYQAEHGRLAISSITVVELVKGLHKARCEDKIATLQQALKDIDVLGLDSDAGLIAGRIDADLERTGQPIGRADPLIAAIAIHHRRTLVTGNMEHFSRIIQLGYELKLDNWRT